MFYSHPYINIMITYFHRGLDKGPSIKKVTQTIVSGISDKKEYYVPYSGASLRDVIGNIIFIYRNRDRNGINHITGDIHYGVLGLIGCKSILTIHDTVLVEYRLKGIKRAIATLLWYTIPLLIASKVVCISEATKKRLQRFTRRKDIIVIYNAIDPLFYPAPFSFKKTNPNILIIGTSPNKNVEHTLRALKDIPCHVTIIGNLNDNQLSIIKENSIHYSNKCNLTDEQIVDEYINADIVSFISLFEGFGMIVIESNMVGRPVICSDIEVLHEIGSNAAFYVNEADDNDMKSGFMRLIQDDGLRETIINNGFENVKRFDSYIIRNQWLSLYKEVESE